MAEYPVIGQIPIMAECKIACLVVHHKGLNIRFVIRRTCCGIPVVSDRGIALKIFAKDVFIFENICNKPDAFLNIEVSFLLIAAVLHPLRWDPQATRWKQFLPPLVHDAEGRASRSNKIQMPLDDRTLQKRRNDSVVYLLR